MAASNTFLGMIMAWELAVPAELRDEEPRILLRLLALGNVGIQQSELIQELGIRQSRLSKLLSRLSEMDPQLITIEELPNDRRGRRYRSTPAADELLGNMEKAMAIFFPS
jgi:DNA-binding MarR family transcriptional regulator